MQTLKQLLIGCFVLFIVFTVEITAQPRGIVRKNLFTTIQAPSAFTDRQTLGKVATATFNISYSADFPDSARTAFQFAVDIYKFILNTNTGQTVNIYAVWDSTLDSQKLAEAGPTAFYPINSDTTLKYPVALAEYKLNTNLNGDNSDIHAQINKNQPWYYGTDGIPQVDKVDFVETVVHELMHGFGMTGIFSYDATTGKGSWTTDGYRSIYDNGCISGNNHGTSIYKLTNRTIFPSPSSELGVQMISGNLYFDGNNSYGVNYGSTVKLFSPSTWAKGSSIYHLDSAVFKSGTGNGLMGPAGHYGSAIHSPGEIGLEILEDLGWSVNRIITITSPLAGDYLQPGQTYKIKWGDNKGGSVSIQLLKKNAAGQFSYYADVTSLFIGAKPLDSLSSWTIPVNYPNDQYRLKMLDATNGYSFSGVFIISNLPTVATPTCNPVPGYYTTTQSVSIHCITDSVQIFYTKDRTDPSSSSTRIQYTSGQTITVDKDMEIRAIANRTNYNSSKVAIAAYYIGPYVPPPTINLENGTYPIETKIIATAAPGTMLMYTSCFPASGCSGTFAPPGPTDGTWWTYPYYSYPYAETIKFKFRSYVPSSNTWGEIIERTYTLVNGTRIAQLDNTLNSFGQWKRFEGNHWEPYPDTRFLPVTTPTTYPLLAEQNYKSGTAQKYQQWTTSENDIYIVNHSDVSVKSTTQSIFARFLSAELAKIQIQVDNVPITGYGTIQFKDPWLIDSTDQYGTPTNRSLNALIKNRTSPLTLDSVTSYNGDIYRGVFLNQFPPTDTSHPPYYTVRVPLTQSINTIASTFLNWSYDPNSISLSGTNPSGYDQKAVVFKQANATLSANYKGHMASNSASAISNSSQRKVVRTYGPATLHAAYESMGYVWYETSTDEGATWQIMNGGQPISASGGRLPSLCSVENVYGADAVLIAYQEGSSLKLKCFAKTTSGTTFNYLTSPTDIASNLTGITDANPVVTWTITSGGNMVMVAWEAKVPSGFSTIKGLRYWSANLNMSNNNFSSFSTGTNGVITNASANSSHPTLTAYPGGSNFYIAWQETLQAINYKNITTSLVQNATSTISSGVGYNGNTQPSIMYNSSDNSVYVAWIGNRKEQDADGEKYIAYRAIVKNLSNSTTTVFGDFIYSTTLTLNGDNTFIAAWSDMDGTSKYSRSSSFGTISAFSKNGSGMTGSNVQGIPGNSWSTMYGVMLNTQTSPYQLIQSDNLTPGIQKSEGLASIFNGREGVVYKNDAQFYFAIGDIIVDNASVGFIEIPDSVVIDSKGKANSYLTTKPFTITNNSNFGFGVQYGVVDSAGCSEYLKNGSLVTFNVQLIDNATKEIIDEYDNVSFTAQNVFQYNNIGYTVNTKGAGTKTVQLRLVVNDTFDGEYSVTKRYNDVSIIGLRKNGERNKQVGIKGTQVVTSYALEQNYPNPFNPTTTITYALPNEGHVVLKIFDAVGREVMTLVDSYKSSGRYNVTFDASKLASGMYVYKLVSGEYSAVKKMMLMK
ncbi:MAG: T9SS type A sorting domain-containing protein [Bacteroidota bacterium]|jgi:hypothetical protein